MTTEKALKDRCTQDMIKKMCELAEGFIFDEEDFITDIFILFKDGHYEDNDYFQWDLSDITNSVLFPLLIHRAVEGWNKTKYNQIFLEYDLPHRVRHITDEDKISYWFENYQPENLTCDECAMLDCLLEVLK